MFSLIFPPNPTLIFVFFNISPTPTLIYEDMRVGVEVILDRTYNIFSQIFSPTPTLNGYQAGGGGEYYRKHIRGGGEY
jgi:hypothetical protein